MSYLLLTHSVLRYVVVLLLLVATITAFAGWFGKKMYRAGDNRISLFAMISCHVQVLVGLILYFTRNYQSGFSDMKYTMSIPEIRFRTVEHPLMMLIAFILVTVGRSTSKKMLTDEGKFRRVAIFYGLALLIIFVMIPWPFLKSFGTWI